MRRILLLGLLLLRLPAFAQPADSILNREDTVRMLASQERRLLLDKFYETRLDLVAMILDSLDRCHPDSQLLQPAERLLLYYWIERYDDIYHYGRFLEVLNMDVTVDLAQEHTVWNVLTQFSEENFDMLVLWIDQSGCSDEEFDFLVRLLKTLLSLDDEILISSEAQMIDTDRNFDDYDDAGFWNRFGISCGIGLGTGYFFGDITDFFSVNSSALVSFTVKYQRFHFSLFLHEGNAVLKRDVQGGKWIVGDLIRFANNGGYAGYSVVDNRFLSVTPFIGVASNRCYAQFEQKERGSASGERRFTNILGFDMDVKTFNFFPEYKRNKWIFRSFNIRLNYVPEMTNQMSKQNSGSMFFFTLGINYCAGGW